jgi:membrane protein YqaA with SNARE-associated domain
MEPSVKVKQQMSFLAAVVVTKTFRNALWQLGGPGLILLGLADNSLVPLPGSMDALTIVLPASRKDLWWYYAFMAAIGAVLGGYLTYRLGAEGGKETLEKKISKRRAQKVYRIF